MRAGGAARLSAQRAPKCQAQLPGTVRPVRLVRSRTTQLRSVARDRLAELLSGMRDAEALAAALALEDEALALTAAWSQLPSRLLGNRHGQLTYEEGIRQYISQGAAMQHAVHNGQAESRYNQQPLRVAITGVWDSGGTGAAARELLAEACRRGLVPAEHCCCGAVEAAMQHLPDVESHLQPEPLARALSGSPTPAAAVHIAALADSAWRRVPSTVLGPRPAWLAACTACPDQGMPGWSYGQLLLLAARLGYERVRRALAQPCLELAYLQLHPGTEEERLKLHAAIENLERISGVSFPQLMGRWRGPAAGDALSPPHARPAWGAGLDAVQAVPAGRSGIPTTASWSPAPPAVEGELLQLRLRKGYSWGEAAVEFTPPRLLPPPADVGDYQLPASFSEALLPWAGVQRGRDLFVKGWGSFPVSLDPDPQLAGSCFLPTPAQVRARGYTAALFPQADDAAAGRIRRILADPDSALLANYMVKWAGRLNGPLAARVNELRAVVRHERVLDLPPETLLGCLELGVVEVAGLEPEALARRLQLANALLAVPFERFDWLSATGPPEAGPRILTSCAGGPDGVAWHVLLLTTSHQIAAAGLALKNCVGRSRMHDHISAVRGGTQLLLVLCPGTELQEAKAMAAWTGAAWSEMYEASNQTIRREWREMFVRAEPVVRRIWGSPDDHMELEHRRRATLFFDQLMSWDHPVANAAVADSNVPKRWFSVHLAAALAVVGPDNKAQEDVLGAVLQGANVAGSRELFRDGRCCGFPSLMQFIEALPCRADWDDEGYVSFEPTPRAQ